MCSIFYLNTQIFPTKIVGKDSGFSLNFYKNAHFWLKRTLREMGTRFRKETERNAFKSFLKFSNVQGVVHLKIFESKTSKKTQFFAPFDTIKRLYMKNGTNEWIVVIICTSLKSQDEMVEEKILKSGDLYWLVNWLNAAVFNTENNLNLEMLAFELNWFFCELPVNSLFLNRN